MRILPIVFLVATAGCLPTMAQSGPKKIGDITDLEAGMPRDRVLAGLVMAKFKVEREEGSSDDTDAYNVFKFETIFAGEVIFKDGRVWMATKRLHSTDDNASDNFLAFSLFDALSDHNSFPASEPDKNGVLLQTWTVPAILELQKMKVGKRTEHTIKLLVGPKLLILSIKVEPQGAGLGAFVLLDEVVVRPAG